MTGEVEQRVLDTASKVRLGTRIGSMIEEYRITGGEMLAGAVQVESTHDIDAVNDLFSFVIAENIAVWQMCRELAAEVDALRARVDALEA